MRRLPTVGFVVAPAAMPTPPSRQVANWILTGHPRVEYGSTKRARPDKADKRPCIISYSQRSSCLFHCRIQPSVQEEWLAGAWDVYMIRGKQLCSFSSQKNPPPH